MKRITIALISTFVLWTTGCIKHGRFKNGVPIQPKPYPVLSLSTEKDLALASMVRVVLSQLPANSTACLSFTNLKYGSYLQHEADSVLRGASGGIAKVVTEGDCPPSYGRCQFCVITGNEPKRPEGYVDPYHVTIEDIHYDGANQVRATVTAKVVGYHQIRYCFTRRMSRHNWRAACPAGSNIILSFVPGFVGHPSSGIGQRASATGSP
ncbi:MAG: hypothetical protein ABR582_09275 [Gemmatimonadaceae bacterium]